MFAPSAKLSHHKNRVTFHMVNLLVHVLTI